MSAIARYPIVIVFLHWAMAMGFVGMVMTGLIMVHGDLDKATQFELYQTHKASGVVMLVAVLFRLVCRVFVTAPPLPDSLSTKQQQHAKWGHIALYVGLLCIPLSGWVMVSASPFGLPTFVFTDQLKWPHIPGVARNKDIETAANFVHQWMVYGMGILLTGHVSAVIWHARAHGVKLLQRMSFAKSN